MKASIKLGVFILIMVNAYSHMAQSTGLKVGDKAPPLSPIEWLKGEPVTDFQRGQNYVVEFSGTWCPPCRKAIPHLTEIAHKYKEVKIISIYNEQNDISKPEDTSYINKVRALLKVMGNKMDFNVAVDDPWQRTTKSWHVTGFPTAFVVNGSGIVVWQGSPMFLEAPLLNLLNGAKDLNKVIESQDDFKEFVWNTTTAMKQEGHYKKAVSGIDSLIKVYPEYKSILYYRKFSLLAGDNDNQAYQWLVELLDSNIENFDWPHFLHEFNNINPENRNYQLELRACDRTIEESESIYHTASPLATKAETFMAMGDFNEAVETYKKAIENSKLPGGSLKTTRNYKERLIMLVYRKKLEENVDIANEYLKKEISDQNLTIDYRLIEMVIQQNQLDLVLELLDTALKTEFNIRTRIYYWDKTAEVYKKQNKNALEKQALFKALMLSDEIASQYYITLFKGRLAKLNDKQ